MSTPEEVVAEALAEDANRGDPAGLVTTPGDWEEEARAAVAALRESGHLRTPGTVEVPEMSLERFVEVARTTPYDFDTIVRVAALITEGTTP